jgi:oligoribonuclease NrnB/cAMP/cGMP phosphodiesterase (DHH superfamily)
MDLLITHANCNDGYHAHLVVKLAFPRIKTLFCSYGDKIDAKKIKGKDVLIVDFSFNREELLDMKSIANSLTLIDHHKTAMDDLGDLDFCHFDMDHSGAVLAWMKLFPGDDIPKILLYVEDRDLWLHKMPDSKAVSYFMNNSTNDDVSDIFARNVAILDRCRGTRGNQYPPGRPVSRAAFSQLESDLIKEVISTGSIYEKIIKEQVRRTCLYHKPSVRKGVKIAIVNSTSYHSEIGAKLVEMKSGESFIYDYAYIWLLQPDGRVKVSLRANANNPNAADVSEVAKERGGGGHRNAAGYFTNLMEIAILNDETKEEDKAELIETLKFMSMTQKRVPPPPE